LEWRIRNRLNQWIFCVSTRWNLIELTRWNRFELTWRSCGLISQRIFKHIILSLRWSSRWVFLVVNCMLQVINKLISHLMSLNLSAYVDWLLLWTLSWRLRRPLKRFLLRRRLLRISLKLVRLWPRLINIDLSIGLLFLNMSLGALNQLTLWLFKHIHSFDLKFIRRTSLIKDLLTSIWSRFNVLIWSYSRLNFVGFIK
jgi:hypothetical protein